ncbi:MAG: hypothetical protein JW827_12195, partial [Spirochaetes bacterium]|nr:hypothetical protein [Spirochaetota bacterium]
LDKYIISITKNYREISRSSAELEKALQMLVNINMDDKDYIKALHHLKLMDQYFPSKEIKEKITVLSNNLRYYEK